MDLLAGPVLERPPGQRPGSAFRYAELAPRPPLPKATTLQRWRSCFAAETSLGLRLPEACWLGDRGPLRPDERAIGWVEEAIATLRPATVVLRTGSRVTTGARDRQRLRAYVSALPDLGEARLVWRATGLWEPDVLQSMAKSLGVIGGIDGIDDPVPATDVVYVALEAEGLRRSFSKSVLSEISNALTRAPVREAFVAIESNQSIREAASLQALFEGAA